MSQVIKDFLLCSKDVTIAGMMMMLLYLITAIRNAMMIQTKQYPNTGRYCYAIRTKTQSVRFVLLSIHFQHKYNRLMWMNNRIFSVWISAYYFISRHTLFFYLSLSSLHSFPLVLVLLLVFSLSHLLSSYAVWFAVWTKHDLDCIAIAFVRHANQMNNSVIWFCSRTRPNIVYCARTTH